MHIRYRRWSIWFFIISFSAGLLGCKVGPNFHSPKPPPVHRYTSKRTPKRTAAIAGKKAGKSQVFVMGRDIPGEWWQLYHSKPLDILIMQGIANNPNLQAAEHALVEQRELLYAQIGESYFPQVGLNLEGTNTKFSALSIGFPAASTFTLYTAKFSGTYLLDFFGGQRRLVESYRAKLDYHRYEMLAAYLSLTSNIVNDYVNIASLQAQIETTRELINDERKILKIVRQQYRVGGASEANVISQQTLLAQTEADLPPLEKDLNKSQHALAILIGKYPSQFKSQRYSLNSMQLPRNLPLSLPSFLVKQRPDIQASEALLHEASAQVGVATANMYPQIKLIGDYGWVSSTLSNFFDSRKSIWTYGAQIFQPIFQGGALHAKKKAAVEAYQRSLAQYHETVLEAFKEVADALRAIQWDAKEYRAKYQAEVFSMKTLGMTLSQFRVGGVNYIDVLNAEQKYIQTKLNRIKAQASRYSDTAALFHALGGGWWNNPIRITSLKEAGVIKPIKPSQIPLLSRGSSKKHISQRHRRHL